MGKFDVKIDKKGNDFDVTIAGVIDEDIDFNNYSLSGANQVKLDLAQIKSINSCGIREWIKWVSEVPSAKFVYSNCPKIIIDQINMVQGFLPTNGKVESFFVPYYNEESGSEKNVLFTFGKEFDDKTVSPPKEVKDDEGQPMEMDVVEAKYFKFIKK